MNTLKPFTEDAPTREAVDALPGPVVLEFGNDWCEHCQASAPFVAEAIAAHPELQHLRIADGRGRPLGRSFRVKLWPTLIFMRDGVEQARLVRPLDSALLAEALGTLGLSD